MTMDQLRIFIAVAERAHVTKAAEMLGLSQSAVSAAVKALERGSGVRLFNRVGRRIELAPAGQRFLPEAKAVIERWTAARNVLQHDSAVIAGSLAIAASQTIASYWLPRRLAAFQEEYPAVRLNVSIGNTRRVENEILDGAADIGFVEGRTESDLLRRRRIARDRLMLVVARTHPPIAEASPGKPDLGSLRWIVREGGSGTREVLQDLARRMRMAFDDLRVFLVLPSNEAVVQAVEAGAGATIMSELVVRKAIADGSLRHVRLTLPRREFALISHRDRQPAAAQTALKSFLLAHRDAR